LNLRHFVPGSILALSLLIGAGALATHARENASYRDQPGGKDAPLTVGNVARVDMESVFDASDAPDLMEQKATETGKMVMEALNRITNTPYLEQQELIEYVSIIAADKPTPAQQMRLDELKTLSGKRAQEYSTLTTKNPLSAEDKKRLQELQAETAGAQNLMPAIESNFRMVRQSRLDTYRKEQMARLRDVVAKVAKDHGIVHVFDATTLIYSTNDITQEVIRKVSKHPNK
jgi:Skp family chaperone for outer membrane proteins